MAPLGSLPPEVFGQIAGLMDDGHWEGTLAALAATCRGFYKLTMPFLYSHVTERHPNLLYWAAHVGRVDTARRVMDSGAPVDVPMTWSDTTKRDFETCCGRGPPRPIYQRLQTKLAGSSLYM
jgi:hypothetical protein